MKRCEACGKDFEPKTAQAKYCKRQGCVRTRARLRKRSSLGNVVELPRPEESEPVGGVVAATLRELEAAGKLDTTLGRSALVLARQLDEADGDTGSSKAAVVRQLQASMAEIMRDVPLADSPLDELRAKREKRRRRGA